MAMASRDTGKAGGGARQPNATAGAPLDPFIPAGPGRRPTKTKPAGIVARPHTPLERASSNRLAIWMRDNIDALKPLASGFLSMRPVFYTSLGVMLKNNVRGLKNYCYGLDCGLVAAA